MHNKFHTSAAALLLIASRTALVCGVWLETVSRLR